jgi:hypothetical protein
MSVNYCDEILSENLEKELHDTLLSPYFPWYFNDTIANGNNNEVTDFQFIHTLFTKDGEWISSVASLGKILLEEATKKFGIKKYSLIRMKANLQTLSGYGANMHSIHKDEYNTGYKSLLYYVNDSDGNTLIIDEKKENIIQQVSPKRNSAILFDSNTWHSSSPPLKNKRRVVINTILKV